jgi:DNA-binding NtrC family response regulator
MRRACGRRPAEDVPRFIAASTMSLAPRHDHGFLLPELRELFEVSLRIPPLRLRPDDVVMLAPYFLHDQNPRLALRAGAMRTLRSYPFPGNIRELRNLMTRLAIVPLAQHARAIGAGDLVTQLAPGSLPDGPGGTLWQLTREKSHVDAARRAPAVFDGDIPAVANGLGDSHALIRLTTAAVPKNPRPRKTRGRSDGIV